MFGCLNISRCTFFKLQYFSRGELPTPKGVVIPKIWFVVLEEYHIMHSEKGCVIVKGISHVLTCSMCSSFEKIYCEKGIACARGFMFDKEVE